MVNACADPGFLPRRGGGSKPNGEKTAFLCLFWGFLVQNFPGDAGRGPTIYEGGPNANFYRI